MDLSLARSVEGSATPPRELAQKALQANIAHQHALTKYSRQLEAELQELESLMVRLANLCVPSDLLTRYTRVP